VDLTRECFIKKYFEKHIFLKISIQNHVSGFRVSISDLDFGEINSETGKSLEDTIVRCLGSFEDIKNKKIKNKINDLEDKKKNIKRELDIVNKELSNIKMSLFKNEN